MPKETVRVEGVVGSEAERVDLTSSIISVGWMRDGYVQVGVVRYYSKEDQKSRETGIEPEGRGAVVTVGYPGLPDSRVFVRFDTLGSLYEKSTPGPHAHWRDALSGATVTWIDILRSAEAKSSDETYTPIYLAAEQQFQPLTAHEQDQAWSDNLSRREVNDLIRNLRKARDACHGKDE